MPIAPTTRSAHADVIGAFLEALNNFRLLLEISALNDLDQAYAEIERWQHDMRSRYGLVMEAEDSSSE